ncbi:MAG: uracil phosphoribosyltransferase, partial [Bacteroidales bacterium]|nr:uracil phosphoribosyltransferase [Bacteroidales bacterium]
MKKIKNLGLENTIFNQYIAEIRDVKIQKDPMRFRRNLERIGEIFAYEISKTFTYHPVEVTTPL